MARIEAKLPLGRRPVEFIPWAGGRSQDPAKMPQLLVAFPTVVNRRSLGGSAGSIASFRSVFRSRGSRLGRGYGFP
jgi:hypothetical protein